jgi:hypothetical protein
MVKIAAAALVVLLVVAGCGPTASTSTSLPASPAPSAAPRGAPSGSPVGNDSPAANGSPAAGGPVVERALAVLHSDTFAGHVDQVQTASTVIAGKDFEIVATMSLDVSGPDLSAHLESGTEKVKVDSDIVIVGRSAYTRSKGGRWTTVPRAAVAGSLTSLVAALTIVSTPAQLRDVGLETIDGRSVHHLAAASKIPYSTSSGTTGRYDTFDLFVADDGTPVLFKSEFTGEQGGTPITGTTEVRYSKIGGPISISAPKDGPTPSG